MHAARWAGAGTLVVLVLALALIDPRLFVGGDNAAYYALAKALTTGRGYVDLVSPGAPPHVTYPPGFPILLIPFYLLFKGSIVGLKLASWLSAAVVLWKVFALAREDRGIPVWVGGAIVWVVGLYPVFLAYSHWVLSEMTFLAVVLATLVLFHRATHPDDEEGRDGDQPWGEWLAACALAAAAFVVRTSGVTLLAAGLLWAVYRRRWRRAAVLAGATAIVLIPWFLWSSAHSRGGAAYLRQLVAENPYDPEGPIVPFGLLLRGMWNQVVHYTTMEFPQLFWPTVPVPTVVRVVGLAIGGVLLGIGAWRVVRRRGVAVWDLYTLLTTALLVIWPWSGDRFFLTVAPLVWLYVLVGADWASRRVQGTAVPAVATTTAVAVVLLIGAVRPIPAQWAVTRAHMEGQELAGYPAFWVDYYDAAQWVGDHNPDAVILARKPRMAWYWSERPSLVYPFRDDPAGTWNFIRESGVTHILLEGTPSSEDYLIPALQEHLDELETVYSAPARSVHVLRLLPEE